MRNLIFDLLFFFLFFPNSNAEVLQDLQRVLFDPSVSSFDPDGYYRVSDVDFKCLQRLKECSSTGWSLRFQMRLNSMTINNNQRSYQLFSSGAHEVYGEGIVINLIQSKSNSYLEVGIKEYQTDQVAYYWQLEIDVEINQWIDMITIIKKQPTHHVLTVYLDGYFYKETVVENYADWSAFRYKEVRPKVITIHGKHPTGLSIFKNITYYEHVLTEEEIGNVPTEMIDLGCVSEYRMEKKTNNWQQCRNECFRRKMKIGVYSPSNGYCGCIENSNELNSIISSPNQCFCPLDLSTVTNEEECFIDNQWHILAVSRAIDYVDSEVGLQVETTDRLRVLINENIDIIVSVNNERNLASLTVYGDIENHENHTKTNETYIAVGVVSLSWKYEGMKTIVIRADYRRPVNNITSEYQTLHIEVVFIKTDLPLQFMFVSPDTPDGDSHQRFLVQSLGAVPINCTIDYGDGHRQSNGTNRHQFYTTYFTHNYRRIGQYNATVECTNDESTKKSQLTRTIRRKNLKKKSILYQRLIDNSTAKSFRLISRNDFLFSHSDCLQLRNEITNQQLKVIWRNKTLEIISNQALSIGKHLFQLECNSISLQPYLLHIQRAIHSINLMATETFIRVGQTIDFSIELEPTQDITIIFNCHSYSDISNQISFIEEIFNRSSLFVGRCTYSKVGQYRPWIDVFNHVSRRNQSIQIRVEETLAPFRIEIANSSDISPSIPVIIRSLQSVSFEGLFNFTLINSKTHLKNLTRVEYLQFSASNNYTDQVYIDVSTYGEQTLLVSGGDSPIIRQAQTEFIIGSDMTVVPQVYLMKNIARKKKDIVWMDIQWIDGIGFDIEIDLDMDHQIEIFYEELITTIINQTMENVQYGYYCRRITDRRVQIGIRYGKSGTYKIGVTFLQPSLKRLSVELPCSTVKIIDENVNPSNSRCTTEGFYLSSPNALNNVSSSSSSVLLLPSHLQHHLQLSMTCSKTGWIHSSYLLVLNVLNQKYSPRSSSSFPEEYLSNFSMIIEPNSLPLGHYRLHITIYNTQSNQLQDYSQSIEIVRSEINTKLNDHQTITHNGDVIKLDFLSNTDLNAVQRVNFTLVCYPESNEKHLFPPHGLRLGLSRPNTLNAFIKLIPWSQLNLILHRPELNFNFYEHQCLSSNDQSHSFTIDSQTREMNINEEAFLLNNQTLHFDLIMRYLIDGRLLITRRTLSKRIQSQFNSTRLRKIEYAVTDLDELIEHDPQHAIEIVGDLAEKLNDISRNSSFDDDIMNLKEKNQRMSLIRSKMLSSIDTILSAVSDLATIKKAIRTTYFVTIHADQMPVNNQNQTVGLIEKIRLRLFNLSSTDDPSVIEQEASGLLDIGHNILHAGSTIVIKEKESDPIGRIKKLDLDVSETTLKENDKRIRFAPKEFYEQCDDCEVLPEERWDAYRENLQEENQLILEDRQQIARVAKKCLDSFFMMADFFVDRLGDNETKTIQSESMALTFKRISSFTEPLESTAGNTTIALPRLVDLSISSPVIVKAIQTKENPFMNIDGQSNITGDVISIILSKTDGSEISVKNTNKPIAIRLTRPVSQYPTYQTHTLLGTSLRYHQVLLPKNEMTLSVHISPVEATARDTYAVYVSYGMNESTIESPTEFKFDFVYYLPNVTSNCNVDDEDELKYTIFMPPTVHRGNGTYIFGVRRMMKDFSNETSTYRIGMYISGCHYWNEEKYFWSQDGCQVGSQTTVKSTECLCNHLTTFGGDFYVPPNSIDFKTVFTKFKNLHENAVVFSTVIAIIVIYLIGAFFTRRVDQKDLIKWTASPLIDNLPVDLFHYLITVHTGVGKESGTTSNISFVVSGELADSGVRRLTDGNIKEFPAGSVRNFVLSVESPLGPLLCLRVWHDNSGLKGKASWYLKMINVLDLQTGEKSHFICDNWLAVEKGDGMIDRIISVASIEELKSFTHLFTQSMKKKLSDDHLWFSVFSRPVRSNFSRVQRWSCCISLLFCTMIANAMFYRQDTQATKNKAGALIKIGPLEFTLAQLWISFISTLVVLPVNLLIVTLFRKAKYSQRTLFSNRNRSKSYETLHNSNYKIEDKTRTFPHWTVYIAWTLIGLSIVTCSFFIILYSMEWGAKRANEWLVTMMLSFGQSILIIDPLKVFVVTAIISLLIRRPYNDETLDFNDPFTEALMTKTSETNGNAFLIDNYVHVINLARQRRNRSYKLKPFDSNRLTEARQQRLNEIKMGEILSEIVIYIIFLVVVIFLSYQARDTNSHNLYANTKHLVVTEKFQEINSIDKWWKYCHEDLLPGLYAQQWYNGKNVTWREKLTAGSRESIRVGPARFRQLRIKDQSCRVHRRVQHVIEHCRDDYNWIEDDTKDYQTGWTNTVQNTTRCKTPWCYQNSIRTKSAPKSAVYSLYKGGGYVMSLGRNVEKSKSLLADLQSHKWLDQFTRVLFVEFSLYNANVNLFVAVTLSIEMTSMGSMIQDYQIKIFRLYDHLGGYGIVVLIVELLFICFTVHGVIHETKLVVKLRRVYFHQFWNLHAFTTCVLSIAVILMYKTKKTLTRLAIRSLRKSEMDEFVNFNTIANFDEVYSYIVALITFLTMIKVLKLLRFNRRIGVLSQTLRYARRDLGSFAFVFIIFMVAYAQMGYILLGRSIPSFKSFSTSLTTCFRMLLGEINAREIIAVGQLYGVFYFLSFTLLVFIVLLAIFLTILNESFAHVKRDLAALNQQHEMTAFITSTFRKMTGMNKNNNNGNAKAETSANFKQARGDAPLAAIEDHEF